VPKSDQHLKKRKQKPKARTPRKKFFKHVPPWLRPKLAFLYSHAENRELFFDRIAEIFPRSDERFKLIEKAYDTAKSAFRHRWRSEKGVRYFEHLRAAALIGVVYLRLRDANLIAALLLHDIIEDIPSWTQEKIAREFNREVADLVWWVSKPPKRHALETKEDVDRRYHRKLERAPRNAIIIKLCDRLHNLITLWSVNVRKMRDKVSETRDFIMPIAEEHQLLIHEIEDVLRIVEKNNGFGKRSRKHR
jgi:(p)ppGpp synthase/HD superfamily hydrolase